MQQLEKKNHDPNWGPSVNSLEHCPDFDERFTLADGKTRAIPFPEINFNCNKDWQMMQRGPQNLAQSKEPWGPAYDSLPHCPDFDERFTLNDGKTRGIPYPEL